MIDAHCGKQLAEKGLSHRAHRRRPRRCWSRRATTPRSAPGRCGAPSSATSRTSSRRLLERQLQPGTVILVDGDDDDTVLTANGEEIGAPIDDLPHARHRRAASSGRRADHAARVRRRRVVARRSPRRELRPAPPARQWRRQRPRRLHLRPVRPPGGASGSATAPTAAPGTRSSKRSSAAAAAGAARPRRARRRRRPAAAAAAAVRSADVVSSADERFSSGIAELDRVLGGGIVPGSLVLVGGEPGIGKSTLLLQVLDARRPPAGARCCSSAARSRRRRSRCAPSASAARPGDIDVLAETELETVLEARRRARRPALVVVDSVQTLYSDALHVGAGQREPGARGDRAASCAWPRTRGAAVFLVGHVTKEGAIAGPRVLEHMVDTVLQFEGDRDRFFRTAARRQEPLRLHQRARRLRDGRARPRGRAPTPPRSSSAERGAGAARACTSPSRARAASWSRSRRSSTRPSWRCRAASRPVSTAIAWPCSWPSSAATAASLWQVPTFLLT